MIVGRGQRRARPERSWISNSCKGGDLVCTLKTTNLFQVNLENVHLACWPAGINRILKATSYKYYPDLQNKAQLLKINAHVYSSLI